MKVPKKESRNVEGVQGTDRQELEGETKEGGRGNRAKKEGQESPTDSLVLSIHWFFERGYDWVWNLPNKHSYKYKRLTIPKRVCFCVGYKSSFSEVFLFLFSFIKGGGLREVSGNVFACEGACVCVGEKEKKRVRWGRKRVGEESEVWGTDEKERKSKKKGKYERKREGQTKVKEEEKRLGVSTKE